jgi:hypothetical protein
VLWVTSGIFHLVRMVIVNGKLDWGFLWSLLLEIFVAESPWNRFSWMTICLTSAFLPPATGMRRVIESLYDMLKLCPWDSSTSHDIISCLCLEGFTYGLIDRRVLLRNAVLWRQLLRHECEACGLINFSVHAAFSVWLYGCSVCTV